MRSCRRVRSAKGDSNRQPVGAAAARGGKTHDAHLIEMLLLWHLLIMLIFAERGGGTRVAEAAADDVYYLATPCGSLAIREGLPVRPRESCWGRDGGERGEEEREGMRRGGKVR